MKTFITQRKNGYILFTQLDFDRIVAENFGDICRALAKRIHILTELKALQKEQTIGADDILKIITNSFSQYNAFNVLTEVFALSEETADLILKAPAIELYNVLDYAQLKPLIEQHLKDLQELIKSIPELTSGESEQPSQPYPVYDNYRIELNT